MKNVKNLSKNLSKKKFIEENFGRNLALYGGGAALGALGADHYFGHDAQDSLDLNSEKIDQDKLNADWKKYHDAKINGINQTAKIEADKIYNNLQKADAFAGKANEAFDANTFSHLDGAHQKQFLVDEYYKLIKDKPIFDKDGQPLTDDNGNQFTHEQYYQQHEFFDQDGHVNADKILKHDLKAYNFVKTLSGQDPLNSKFTIKDPHTILQNLNTLQNSGSINIDNFMKRITSDSDNIGTTTTGHHTKYTIGGSTTGSGDSVAAAINAIGEIDGVGDPHLISKYYNNIVNSVLKINPEVTGSSVKLNTLAQALKVDTSNMNNAAIKENILRKLISEPGNNIKNLRDFVDTSLDNANALDNAIDFNGSNNSEGDKAIFAKEAAYLKNQAAYDKAFVRDYSYDKTPEKFEGGDLKDLIIDDKYNPKEDYFLKGDGNLNKQELQNYFAGRTNGNDFNLDTQNVQKNNAIKSLINNAYGNQLNLNNTYISNQINDIINDNDIKTAYQSLINNPSNSNLENFNKLIYQKLNYSLDDHLSISPTAHTISSSDTSDHIKNKFSLNQNIDNQLSNPDEKLKFIKNLIELKKQGIDDNTNYNINGIQMSGAQVKEAINDLKQSSHSSNWENLVNIYGNDHATLSDSIKSQLINSIPMPNSSNLNNVLQSIFSDIQLNLNGGEAETTIDHPTINEVKQYINNNKLEFLNTLKNWDGSYPLTIQGHSIPASDVLILKNLFNDSLNDQHFKALNHDSNAWNDAFKNELSGEYNNFDSNDINIDYSDDDLDNIKKHEAEKLIDKYLEQYKLRFTMDEQNQINSYLTSYPDIKTNLINSLKNNIDVQINNNGSVGVSYNVNINNINSQIHDTLFDNNSSKIRSKFELNDQVSNQALSYNQGGYFGGLVGGREIDSVNNDHTHKINELVQTKLNAGASKELGFYKKLQTAAQSNGGSFTIDSGDNSQNIHVSKQEAQNILKKLNQLPEYQMISKLNDLDNPTLETGTIQSSFDSDAGKNIKSLHGVLSGDGVNKVNWDDLEYKLIIDKHAIDTAESPEAKNIAIKKYEDDIKLINDKLDSFDSNTKSKILKGKAWLSDIDKLSDAQIIPNNGTSMHSVNDMDKVKTKLNQDLDITDDGSLNDADYKKAKFMDTYNSTLLKARDGTNFAFTNSGKLDNLFNKDLSTYLQKGVENGTIKIDDINKQILDYGKNEKYINSDEYQTYKGLSKDEIAEKIKSEKISNLIDKDNWLKQQADKYKISTTTTEKFDKHEIDPVKLAAGAVAGAGIGGLGKLIADASSKPSQPQQLQQQPQQPQLYAPQYNYGYGY